MSNKKPILSEEELERRRQNALQLVKAGKLGGKQPGAGRPRKKRASEIVAEKASQEAQKIAQAFEDALEPHNPASVRLTAAKEWLKVEQEEAKLQMEEEKHVNELQTNQLIDLITTKLQKIHEAGVLENIIDGEIVDVIEEGSSISSEGHPDVREEGWAGWPKE